MTYTLSPVLPGSGVDRLPIYYVNLNGAPIARLRKGDATQERAALWCLELDPGRTDIDRPPPFSNEVYEFRSLNEAAIWLGILRPI